MELTIEKFSPTKAELATMAAEAQTINQESAPAKIKEMRISLKKARTTITKMGKELREDAVAFQKAVITKEKELIAIIEPEEDRLERIEADAERIREREERREFLPRRQERLAAIRDSIEVLDEDLLEMDGAAFEGYLNLRVANKNEADRRKLEADQKQIDDEKAELQRKKDLAEAEERGRKVAEEKAQREKTEREQREAREKREADERAEREEREAEDRKHQEEEKRSRDERYQAFLKEHGYSPLDSKITAAMDGVITLWKKVATFDPRQMVDLLEESQ